MDKKQIKDALQKLRTEAKERKFTQTVELIVNLKDLNIKNPDEQVEFYANLPKAFGKKKICAIVAGELFDEAKKVCDFVITQGELDKYKADKKAAKKLADEYDYFVAQANIMAQIAGTFGRVFGPRGKMPNPKAGCVVPPKAALQPLYDRLQNTEKVAAKKFPVIQLTAGKLDMSDDDITDNILYLYDQVEHHLPKEKHNVRSVILKLTMGKPLRL